MFPHGWGFIVLRRRGWRRPALQQGLQQVCNATKPNLAMPFVICFPFFDSSRALWRDAGTRKRLRPMAPQQVGFDHDSVVWSWQGTMGNSHILYGLEHHA